MNGTTKQHDANQTLLNAIAEAYAHASEAAFPRNDGKASLKTAAGRLREVANIIEGGANTSPPPASSYALHQARDGIARAIRIMQRRLDSAQSALEHVNKSIKLNEKARSIKPESVESFIDWCEV